MAKQVAERPSVLPRAGPVRPRQSRLVREVNRRLGTLSLLGGITIWELLGRLWGVSWLPPFSSIIRDLVELISDGVIIGNLLDSLLALALGFGLALVGGLTVGALMGRYRRVEQALDIYVYAFFIAPTMIFVPIFFAVFGLSEATRVAVIVMYSVFVMVINTATAVRVVDTSLIEMARSFGAHRDWQIFREVLIPAALPLVFAGIKLGMGRAVKGMINSEMFIAFIGLGALAQRYGGQFDSSKVFAVALVILVVALLANMVVQIIDRKLTAWTDA